MKTLSSQRHREFISLLELVNTQENVISKRFFISTNEIDFSMNEERHDVSQEDVSSDIDDKNDDKNDEDDTKDVV